MMRKQPKIKRPFTGWHMTVILVTFFGIVIAVNFTMARLAIGGFGGTVVDNSYVASQNFNRWLAKAEAQDALGWDEDITLDNARHVIVAVSAKGVVLTGVMATGEAVRPVGAKTVIALDFEAVEDGSLRSRMPLPRGRWRADLTVRKNTDIARFRQEFQ